MADRTATVSLVAEVNGYVNGMQRAAEATRATSTEAQRLGRQSETMSKVGLAAGLAGAAIVAGLGAAVKAAADFDAQMAQLQTLSHATGSQMEALRASALSMGEAIGFSATQVADAEIELTKAGVSVKDQLGGALKGALDLAAAGQLDVGEATQYAASAMVQFGLAGKDVPHIADLLAAGADKALGSVADLGNGLKYVGPVAKQLGISIDETVGSLALLAQNGILGEQSGTELRGVLLSLTAPSQQAAGVMQKYGITLYDAQGKFIGVDGAAQQLKTHLGPLSDATRDQALGQIFGNAQVTAASILYSGGAKAVDKWTAAVNDNGFATQQAQGKLNSLNGDLSKLQSAFQSGLISTGESASVSLRGVVQNATGLVQSFNNMSNTGKTAVFVIGAVAAGTLTLGAGFLTVVPKIAAAKVALSELNASGVGVGKVLGVGGGIALGITALAGAVAGLSSKSTLASNELASLDSALSLNKIGQLNKEFQGGGGLFDAVSTKSNGIKDALNDLSSGLGKVNTQSGKAFDGLLGGLTNVSATAKRFAAQFEEIGVQLGQTASTSLPAATKSFDQLVKAAGGGTKAASELLAVMPDYQAQLIKLAEASNVTLSKQDLLNLAQGKGTVAAQILAGASGDASSAIGATGTVLDSLASSSSTASGAVTTLTQDLEGFTAPTLDARQAARDYQAAIDAVTSTIKDNAAANKDAGNSLDITTDEGRKNQAALDAIASSAENLAGKLYAQTGSQQDATKAMSDGHDALVAALQQYGITGQAAQDYADQIEGTPTQWATLFTAETSDAAANTDGLQKKISQTPLKTLTTAEAKVDDAQANIDALILKFQQVPPSKRTDVQAEISAASANLRTLQGQLDALQSKSIEVQVRQVGSSVVAKAAGGAVYGPGTGTSDSINARLSNGEFVVTAAAASRVGIGFLDALNAGSGSSSADRYAQGASVAPVYVQAPAEVAYASAGGSRIGSLTQNIVTPDPSAAARSVVRRIKALGA